MRITAFLYLYTPNAYKKLMKMQLWSILTLIFFRTIFSMEYGKSWESALPCSIFSGFKIAIQRKEDMNEQKQGVSLCHRLASFRASKLLAFFGAFEKGG